VAQDPLCSSLQNGIQTVAGVDVVGAGGCLAGSSGGAGFVSPPPPGGGTPGDTLPPQAQITKGPKNKTKKKKAIFQFTGSDTRAVASFQCSLDGAAFADCSSPYLVSVKKGKHTFQVRAIDQAGNVGSAASDDWKVKKKKKKR
jgi:large repetitive protein